MPAALIQRSSLELGADAVICVNDDAAANDDGEGPVGGVVMQGRQSGRAGPLLQSCIINNEQPNVLFLDISPLTGRCVP